MAVTNGHSHPILPVPNSTKSFWQSNLHELADHRTTPNLPAECDVLIIGAGYAGVGTAYNLAKSDHNPRSVGQIVILEARQACSGATGRNGGHLRPDLYGHIPTYIERHGIKAATDLAEYEAAHVQAIKQLIAKEKIDCDFTLTRCTDTWANEEAAKQAKEMYDLMMSKNLRLMNDVNFVYGERAAGVSGVKDAKACASYTAGHLFPYKLIMHLLKSALSTGTVNLQTSTPVTAISNASSDSFTVETPRGSIKAKKIVHANNAYVSGLLPEYAASIVPCKGICCHIAVPKGKVAPHLSNSYVNRDIDRGLSYLIPRSDGEIIVGGAAHLFRPLKEQWYNNTDDSTLIEAAKDYYNGYMQRTFRGWDDTGAYVNKIWTGVMGYSADSLSHVGQVPGKPGQYILAGFNGHGMPVVWLAAKGIASMLLEDKSFEEVGLPHIMKTTVERMKQAQDGPEGGDILT